MRTLVCDNIREISLLHRRRQKDPRTKEAEQKRSLDPVAEENVSVNPDSFPQFSVQTNGTDDGVKKKYRDADNPDGRSGQYQNLHRADR